MVRAEILAKIEQKNNWDVQFPYVFSAIPAYKEAGGEVLGTTSIVALGILLEEIGKILTVPYFSLNH